MGLSINLMRESISIFLSISIVTIGPIQFGFTRGYSNPTQSNIPKDLDLTIEEFSIFGSLANVGAMVGAITNDHIAAHIRQKGPLMIASIPNILWLACYLLRKRLVILVYGKVVGRVWCRHNLLHNACTYSRDSATKSTRMLSGKSATFTIGTIQVIVTGISTTLVGKANRRILFIMSSCHMTLSNLVVANMFYSKDVLPENYRSIMEVIALIGLLVPETKERMLEEIQSFF